MNQRDLLSRVCPTGTMKSVTGFEFQADPGGPGADQYSLVDREHDIFARGDVTHFP